MTTTNTDVFAYPGEFITTKGNILAVEVTKLTSKRVYSYMQIIIREFIYIFDNIIELFPMITIKMINIIIANVWNNTQNPSSYRIICVGVYLPFSSIIT